MLCFSVQHVFKDGMLFCVLKGEEYKLFWPEEPEFVRMAARFGATIVPFGAIGEDDIAKVSGVIYWFNGIEGMNDRVY